VYEWVEHTSELELVIRADSDRGVLEEAVAALAELLGHELGGRVQTREVKVSAADRPGLLVEWIGELAYLAESQRFVAERVAETRLGDSAVEATVEGRVGDPPALVKAATYHRLEFGPDGDGWRARVVLDV